MAAPRYVCIHGHFYQPPRENPWLEAVEVQDSAAPYHDWNERITRECYAPNTRSRLVDREGKITNLLNNYAWLSFNFGPTLLAWMGEFAPDVLWGLVEADRVSRERCGGHGNALAQIYNHVIMPLASERDKRTQVRWGIADFQTRFGRPPEGMWLSETAVDLASLEALAEAGIQFTLLAQRQARRWRRLGEDKWYDGPGAIDPSQAYVCRLPSGKSIALFFYDGAISQQVAFERLLDSGEKFLHRLRQGFDDSRTHPQLLHIATDGESYGHHHAFGDMALAYVLDQLRRDPALKITNYGEFLERHPPEWEVEIHENSSWSCVHGVERWRSDCGCKTRGDWHQKWRGPLRDAFNHLKQRLDSLFATRGRQCFPDPWAARDAYIEVILNRKEETVRRFFRRHGFPDLDESLIREGLWLMEMQRNGLLLYTSCGWFFDEISGLEPVQCLRYAARAIQLATHFHEDLEPDFVARLEKAPSNLPQFPNGRSVWENLVRPWQVDLDRVLAHQAISLLYQPRKSQVRVYCYDLDVLDQEVYSRGGNRVAIGRLKVRSRLTWNKAETNFVVIHYGGLDFYTVLRRQPSPAEYEAFKKRFLDTSRDGSLADVTALVAREFEGQVRRLTDLFQEEQRRVIGIVLHDRFDEYRHAFERLVGPDEDLLARLGQLRYPIPKLLRTSASAYLDFRLGDELAGLETDGHLPRVRHLLEQGRSWGYQPEREMLGKSMGEAMQRLFGTITPHTDWPALIEKAGRLLDVAGLLGISPDLWKAQNHLLDAYAQIEKEGKMHPPLKEAFATLAQKLDIRPELLGWRP